VGSSVDLSDVPTVDVHCFSFAPNEKMSKHSLARLFTAGGPTVMSVKTRPGANELGTSVAYGRLIHELSLLLGTGKDEADVLAARNREAHNFAGYVKMLMEDAKLTTLFLDNGIEPTPFEEFSSFVKLRLRRTFRIEPLIKRLLEDSRDFAELLQEFDRVTAAAVTKGGFIGFKSVIAYRTGLGIEPASETDARRSFGRRGVRDERGWFGPKVKLLRDFLLRRTAETAYRHGVFLQIHTGLGDTDVVADKCNPLRLKAFLMQEEVLKTKVILIHGGFPYTTEAAWLSSVFHNVYFELSTPFPPTYMPALSKRRILDVLEMVPASRVLYGSDSIEIPELHWLAAKITKRSLGEALEELLSSGVISEKDARRIGGDVLSKNATSLVRR